MERTYMVEVFPLCKFIYIVQPGFWVAVFVELRCHLAADDRSNLSIVDLTTDACYLVHGLAP